MEELKEFTAKLENELIEFKNEVSAITDEKSLNELEEKIVKEIEDYEKKVSEKTFELAKEVVFDGKKYSFNDVVNDILYIINKNEVEYKFTLGLYELYNFWKDLCWKGEDKTAVINYSTLDSTLRVLGQVKFSGYSEWKRILVINEFFKNNHAEYVKINTKQVYFAQQHNIVMDQLQLLKPVDPNTIDETEVINQ